jgi:hypothetical protein
VVGAKKVYNEAAPEVPNEVSHRDPVLIKYCVESKFTHF